MIDLCITISYVNLLYDKTKLLSVGTNHIQKHFCYWLRNVKGWRPFLMHGLPTSHFSRRLFSTSTTCDDTYSTNQWQQIELIMLRAHNEIWKTLEGEGFSLMTLKQVSIESKSGTQNVVKKILELISNMLQNKFARSVQE